jgi:hypothetical protein
MSTSVVAGRRPPRSGIAAFWALVVLSVLAVTSAAAAWQFAAVRRTLEGRQHRLQAIWLARSGAELAAARLLADPDGYTGETVEPIPESRVQITVQKDPARPETYRVRCEARYPVDGPGTVEHAVTRTVTRRTEGAKTRVEMLAPGEGEGEAGAGGRSP